MASYIDILKTRIKAGKNVFIASNATLLGDISLADNVSVWYGAVIRADTDEIHVGEATNIQDGVIFHTDPGLKVTVGRENVIGHGAVIHGCTIGDYNLIGMRATILNGAKIGNCCVIGAHALVTENMVIPDYSMVLGVPGRIVKQLPTDIKEQTKATAAHYVAEAMKYLKD